MNHYRSDENKRVYFFDNLILLLGLYIRGNIILVILLVDK